VASLTACYDKPSDGWIPMADSGATRCGSCPAGVAAHVRGALSVHGWKDTELGTCRRPGICPQQLWY
jgi:hypothetical protein